MSLSNYKQRFYASLLILGACILLARTLTMVFQGVFDILVLWVFILLIAEMIIDAGCIITSIPWWVKNSSDKDSIPLSFGAAAAIFHAIRVLIFVLGRTGPWIDFDVRPDQRAIHYTRWTWGEVYFAATLSILGVIGVLVIWLLRKRAKRRLLMKNHQSGEINPGEV
jgi:hypothetical protein